MNHPLKKKLLILVDWFAPGYKAGGPIQSCVNLAYALSKDYDIYVLTTDTDHGEQLPYQNVEVNTWLKNEDLGIHIFYAEKRKISFRQIRKEIKHINPDFIYLNLLFSPYFNIYPLWLKFKNRTKAKVILCPRGSLYESALSLRSFKKKPLLLLYNWMRMGKKIFFHATNEREKKAIEKYFPGTKIIVADNLPNTKLEAFTSCTKIKGELSCIFIARIVPIKNLLFLVQFLKQVSSKVKLSVVGPVENQLYWNECQQAIEVLPENITVEYLGALKHEELRNLILKHHLFVLPTTGENFGHAIFESFLAGRPVLISDQTPWLHLQEHHAGWDIDLAQPQNFTEKIEFLANTTQDEYDQYALGAWSYAKKYLDNHTSISQYKLLFHE